MRKKSLKGLVLSGKIYCEQRTNFISSFYSLMKRHYTFLEERQQDFGITCIGFFSLAFIELRN